MRIVPNWLVLACSSGYSTGLSVAATLAGPWYQVSGNTNYRDWDKFSVPPKSTLCVLAICTTMMA